jgi:hypothetical protein
VCAVLDDLVVALYVTVDELLGKRSRPGRPPRLSDAELVCLAVAQVLLGCNSERRWLRFVGHRLRHLFPYVPGQSGYNRRLRAAAPALRLTLEHLAAPRRRGGTSGGCWTPPRCRAAPRGRRSSAVTWPAATSSRASPRSAPSSCRTTPPGRCSNGQPSACRHHALHEVESLTG